MKISKKEFTKLIKEELKDALEEHEDCEETEEEQPEEEERIKTPRKSKIDPVTGKLLPLPWRLLSKGLSKIGLEEKQALRQIVAEETALVYREELLQEEALIMETQLQILTELRDEGVITEEQLQEIFRALKSMATKTADRARGAMAGAKAGIKGLAASGLGKVAGTIGLDATELAAAGEASSLKGDAATAYHLGKVKSRLTRFAKSLQAQEEDMTKDIADMGIDDNPELKAAMKHLRMARTRAATVLKALTAVPADPEKAAKQLPAGTPAPVSA